MPASSVGTGTANNSKNTEYPAAYPDRVGPFVVGSTYRSIVEKHPIKLLLSSELEHSPLPGDENYRGTGKGCETFWAGKGYTGVYLMFEQGVLTRIDISRPDFDEADTPANRRAEQVRTPEGAGLGDSIAKIRNIYDKSLEERPHPYSGSDGSYQLVMGKDGTHATLFEGFQEKVVNYRIGLKSSVQYIEGCL